jgi:phosphoribosylglycinamide formyltransferase-1
MTSPRTRRLAVLASGRGSNFRALADAAARDALGGAIAVLACDRPDAGAIELARARGIPVELPDSGPMPHRIGGTFVPDWIERLRAHDVDTLLLAGFMRILPPTLLDAFPDRVLNLHPSLLPAFPGLDAIARAHAHGVRQTGCTVHLVTAGIDDGPILGQAAVAVEDGDTVESLTARVHAAEHGLYPEVVHRFLTTPFRLEGRRVVWRPAGGTA